MSPYRRPESPFWYVRPTVTLPGRGSVRLPGRSAEVESKRLAEQIENTLRELPMMGHAELVEAYEAGEYSAKELHGAKLAGRLEDLRERRDDPLLADVLEGVPAPKDRLHARALERLPGLVAEVREARDEKGPVRLSWLLDPAHIQAVLEWREERDDVSPNTVRRGEYQTLGKLLRRVAGEDARARVLSGVDYSPVKDERTVYLSAEQVSALVGAAVEPLAREAITLMVGSGIDVGAVLRIVPADFDAPELRVRDTKTSHRPRTLRLGQRAAAALRRAVALSGAGPWEPVFAWTYAQIHYRITRAAEAAGLRGEGAPFQLRPKDLRGVFATHFLRGGGSVRDLQHILGHATPVMTLRYIKRLPRGEADDMDAAEAMAGLKVLRVVREEGAG